MSLSFRNKLPVNFAESFADRRAVYASIAIFFFLLALLTAIIKANVIDQPFELAVSDGRYYYAYLPSLIIDGDVDFSNQIVEHWGPDFKPELLTDKTALGLVRNKYPIGLALTLLPSFLLGHGIALISNGRIAADGYSWPYQVACLAAILFLVWRTFLLIDQMITQYFHLKGKSALYAIFVFAVCTPFAYYAFREPFMVHAVSSYWCTEVVYTCCLRNNQQQIKWYLPILCFSFAIALVCRPTNLFLLPVVIYGFSQVWQTSRWKAMFTGAPLATLAIIPIACQLYIWHQLYGQWIAYSYQGESFYWNNPALLPTLFSSRHGLFFWSPVLLLSLIALLQQLRKPLILSWMIGALLLWYANSSWHSWWFGDAFGGRSFLELSGLFCVGFAFFHQAHSQNKGLIRVIPPLALTFNLLLMILYITRIISRSDYIFFF